MDQAIMLWDSSGRFSGPGPRIVRAPYARPDLPGVLIVYRQGRTIRIEIPQSNRTTSVLRSRRDELRLQEP